MGGRGSKAGGRDVSEERLKEGAHRLGRVWLVDEEKEVVHGENVRPVLSVGGECGSDGEVEMQINGRRWGGE